MADYKNRLLRFLTPQQRHLLGSLEPAIYRPDEYLFRYGEPVRALFFPEHGIISAILPLRDGEEVKLWTASGPNSLCLGGHTLFRQPVSLYDYRANTAASGWRISRAAIDAAMERDPALLDLFQRMVHLFDSAAIKTIACRTNHSDEQRLCRILLVLRESQGNRITLPRETIARFVPCARTYLFEIIGVLRRDGIISNGRNAITIRDVPALKGRACDCFAELKEMHRALFKKCS